MVHGNGHTTGPNINFTGTFTYNRATAESTWVDCTLKGTLSLGYSTSTYGVPFSGYGLGFTINTIDENAWHGNYYSFPVGGSLHVDEGWSLELTSGKINLYANCDFGSESNTNRYCDRGWDNTLMCSVDVPAYNPHKTPSISLSLPDNVGQWTKQGSSTSIRCVWNRNGDAHQHNIYLSKAGSQIYNVNSDAGNDDFTVSYDTPTNRDTTYEVYGKITDNNDNSYKAEARYTRGVWGLPTISVSVANPNKIVAGNTNRITVTTGKLNSDTGSPTTIWIEVNGTKVKEWTEQSTGSTHTLTYDYVPTADGTTYNIVAKVRHRLFWRRK